MKQTFNTALLVLLSVAGLGMPVTIHSAETTASYGKNVIAVIAIYEIASLLRMTRRGPKADFKQRNFFDMSASLLKKSPKEWAKNVLKNLEITQTDYIEGQTYKGASLKVNHEGKVESGKKCFPCGFNGQLLGLVASSHKALKSIKDVVTLAAAAVLIQKTPINWETLGEVLGLNKSVITVFTDAPTKAVPTTDVPTK